MNIFQPWRYDYIGDSQNIFQSPISPPHERRIGLNYNYKQCAIGRSYGLELDMRKSFRLQDKGISLELQGFCPHFQWIDHSQSIKNRYPNERVISGMQGRLLVFINNGLYYDIQKRTDGQCHVYVIGERIAYVGNLQPSYVSDPKDLLDFTIIKK